MMKKNILTSATLYTLVFLSGASGLIYQVVWDKYLAILLGAQAKATAIVLAIFLGGISAGYIVFGKWSHGKREKLLTAYVLVEVALGLWALLFPFLFRALFPMTGTIYSKIGLNSLWFDILLAAFLLGLPTFLMGGTLPLLTQGLSEDLDTSSRTHARLYGYNTLGACVGCLGAGYYLVPSLSLPLAGTIAAILNLTVGGIFYFLFASPLQGQRTLDEAPTRVDTPASDPSFRIVLAVGFISGFVVITLEAVLMRLVGLATGSSHYNFTLIVSTFILWLGMGSLIARNIHSYGWGRLFWNQVFIGLGLGILYWTSLSWPYAVHLLRATFRDLEASFYVYQFCLGLGFFLLLAVPIGFSGLTLPLCFHLIRDRRENLGYRVGQLYGTNTVGCVLGALVGGYLFFNFFDLDLLFKICIGLTTLSAALIAYRYWKFQNPGLGESVCASAVGASVLALVLFLPGYDHGLWLQPFRYSAPFEASFKGKQAFRDYLNRSTQMMFWKDGPNTSVGIGVTQFDGKEVSRTIFVNGKSDGNTRWDQFTTIMLGHIPGLLSRRLENVAIVGFGTGMTAGALSLYDEVKQIDIAEISNFSIKTAPYFDAYNYAVSASPKVRFHEMDAFRLLNGASRKYDVIVSEPSNPWVAGVENLYSKEFYEIARSKMHPEGVFVQWIHTYSFNDELFRMVLRTMGQHFRYVSIFQLKGGDLALMGRDYVEGTEDLKRAERRLSENALVRVSLKNSDVVDLATVLALEMAAPQAVRTMAESGKIHTLESPRLSHRAAKAFFIGESAKPAQGRRLYREFYASFGDSLLSRYLGPLKRWPWPTLENFTRTFCDSSVARSDYLCAESVVASRYIRSNYVPGNGNYPERDLASIDYYRIPVRQRFQDEELTRINQMFESYKKHASPLAPLPLSSLHERLDACQKEIPGTKALHGECLLQKVVITEVTEASRDLRHEAMQQYVHWFAGFNERGPSYEKLKEAYNLIQKLITLAP